MRVKLIVPPVGVAGFSTQSRDVSPPYPAWSMIHHEAPYPVMPFNHNQLSVRGFVRP